MGGRPDPGSRQPRCADVHGVAGSDAAIRQVTADRRRVVLTFTPSPERFIVEEIPAYPPSGEGDHTFLWIEKRGLTTFDAISAVALALGVSPRDVGYAGMKDRHATTRQWLSVPKGDPEVAQTIRRPELTVLAAVRHPHKLRMGHLRANRFEVVLTGAATDDDMQALRVRFAE